jgi:hypothetical protein
VDDAARTGQKRLQTIHWICVLADQSRRAADIFDAVTSERPYRQGLSPIKALEDNCGYSDPHVVEVFVDVLRLIDWRHERSERVKPPVRTQPEDGHPGMDTRSRLTG